MQAEANNQDPQTIRMDELPATTPVNTPQSTPTVEVPARFQTTDGVPDVDKIKESTRQLDEAIQKKEEAVKTVDDYMREYNERLRKFSGLPNAERIVAQLPPMPESPPPLQTQQADPQNFEEIVRRDYAADPLGTTTRLLDLMIQKKLQPLEDREKAEMTRTNLQALASRDPRILRKDVFDAVTARLNSDPDYWKLKNPHRAAWLDVKDEMRLGEIPQGTPAQPSRPLSPVLGGGTPPSTPSSSVPSSNGNISLDTLNLRDKAQEELGDEAIRRILMGNRG